MFKLGEYEMSLLVHLNNNLAPPTVPLTTASCVRVALTRLSSFGTSRPGRWPENSEVMPGSAEL